MNKKAGHRISFNIEICGQNTLHISLEIHQVLTRIQIRELWRVIVTVWLRKPYQFIPFLCLKNGTINLSIRPFLKPKNAVFRWSKLVVCFIQTGSLLGARPLRASSSLPSSFLFMTFEPYLTHFSPFSFPECPPIHALFLVTIYDIITFH